MQIKKYKKKRNINIQLCNLELKRIKKTKNTVSHHIIFIWISHMLHLLIFITKLVSQIKIFQLSICLLNQSSQRNKYIEQKQ